MRKLTVALLSVAFLVLPGLRGMAAAQTPVTRIVYDQCRGGSWDVFCSIGMAVDGSDTLVANGAGPKWSPDGSRIAFTGTTDPSEPYSPWNSIPEVLVLNLADGSITNLTDPAWGWGPVWSPDGAKIAFLSYRDGPLELYVMDASGANPTRVTHDVGFTGAFGWSPDGNRFAFASEQDGEPELYVTDADGSNVTRLTDNVGFTGSLVWSPDGSRIAFDCLGDGGGDICAINGDGTSFVRLVSGPAKDSGAAFSPVDGRIAFVTDRFGTSSEIAVMDADGVVTRLAAGTGGVQPAWSPDGHRLTFVSTIPFIYTGTCYFGDGAHNADDFCIPVYGTYLVDADGTGLTPVATGSSPDWFNPSPGQPVASFASDCSGATCDFDAAGSFDPDGTIASYLWQFGDGTSSSGPTAHHAYDTGDPHAVTLTVTDDGGATGIVRKTVPANLAPAASFTVTCTGPTCTFDASGSSDADGTIASYVWAFGDGAVTGGQATVTHVYPTGTFFATLIVADNGGAAGGPALRTLSVVNAPPVATFTATCEGLTCAFDGSGSSDPDGTIRTYQWYFGDGGYHLGATASHTFAAGTYTVQLVVTSNDYSTATQSQTLSLGANAPPVASFTSACSGLTCSFDASGSSDPDGRILRYAWDFGDGTGYVSGAIPPTTSRTYAASGPYTVTLTVTDNGNAASQTAHVVTVGAVNAAPVASFTSACSGLTCSFDASGSSDPDGTIASYAWTFGDGATGAGATASRTYPAGGNYTVTLTVTDNANATSQTAHTVTVTAPNVPPVASFTSTCSGLTCSFNASGSSDSDGTITSYAWTFGDGSAGSGVTASRTYAAGGTYTVTLTVTDNANATTQTAHAVTVNAPPVASFTFSCSGLTCSFDASGSSDSDGTITSYAWTFGDGAAGSGVTASRTYAAGGTYTATLTVTDNANATSQTAHAVTVNAPPVASFTFSCSGLTCSFDASGSSDPDGTIASYAWTFGDGATGSGAITSRTYAAGGSYTVTLTVTDNGNATSQTAHAVTVNAPPVASFTSACSGLTCSFDASGSSDPDGTIASYAWTFGDGATGSGATTSRTYAAGGTYTVTLTVTDNANATSQTAHAVTVNAPPVASFTSACSGLTCSFNAAGSSDPDGTITSYAWTFGDGATGSGATASRTYAAGGTYAVTLTVTDNGSATGTQVQNITVVAPTLHVGDLDRASTIQQNAWTATVTITVHTSSHSPLANAVVSAAWSGGSTGSCTTNATGRCAVSRSGIPKSTGSVTLTVTNVALATFVYKPANNHDPDGDSNGSAITVTKP
jgi:PKD repeat protein